MAVGDAKDLFFRRLRSAGLSRPAVETLATRLDALESESGSGAGQVVALVADQTLVAAGSSRFPTSADLRLDATGTFTDNPSQSWLTIAATGFTLTAGRYLITVASNQVFSDADTQVWVGFQSDNDNTASVRLSALGVGPGGVLVSQLVDGGQGIYPFAQVGVVGAGDTAPLNIGLSVRVAKLA